MPPQIRILDAESWRPISTAFLLLATVLQLAGCAVGPKYKTPATPAPPAYQEMGNWKTAQPNDHNLGGNWWELFQDSQLNSLEQQINVSNQNLKAARSEERRVGKECRS